MTIKQHRILQWIAIVCILLAGTGWYYRMRVQGSMQIKAPAKNGLVGYWSMDEGSMTRAGDGSEQGNHGTLNGGVSWVDGKVGSKSLQFDGVDDSVSIPNSASLNPTYISVSAWIKTSTTGVMQQIVAKDQARSDYAITNRVWQFRVNTSNKLEFIPFNATTNANVVGNTTVTDGRWHHVMGTWDGSFVNLYVDGVSDVAPTAFSGSLRTGQTNPVYIGCDDLDNAGAQKDFFTGSIDEVRIYNYALAQAEITKIYQFGASAYKTSISSGLTGYWSMNEGTGLSANDTSGQGNNGTLNGGATWIDGKSRKALSFDGTDDYVDMGAPAASSVMSFSLWINPVSYPTAGVVGYKEPLRKEGSYHVVFRGYASDIEVGVKVATVSQSIIIPQAVFPLNTWTHLAMTADGTSVKAFVNGVQYGSSLAYSGSIDNISANHLFVGTYGTTTPSLSRWFDGSVDEVRIYNRALTFGEINTLYANNPVNAITINAPQNDKLTGGLVGLWSFNGADLSGTTAYDRSGSGNNGTLTNGPVPTIGKIGQALSFNGSTRYVAKTTPTGLPTGASTRTYAAWFKMIGAPASGLGYEIMGHGSNLGTGKRFAMWIGNNAGCSGYSIGVELANAGKHVAFTPDTQWHHLTLTYPAGQTNSDQTSIYLDGVLQTSFCGSSATTLNTDNDELTIGRIPTVGAGVDYFSGSIDEVRIYNRALSATEVWDLYNLGR